METEQAVDREAEHVEYNNHEAELLCALRQVQVLKARLGSEGAVRSRLQRGWVRQQALLHRVWSEFGEEIAASRPDWAAELRELAGTDLQAMTQSGPETVAYAGQRGTTACAFEVSVPELPYGWRWDSELGGFEGPLGVSLTCEEVGALLRCALEFKQAELVAQNATLLGEEVGYGAD